MWIGVCLHLEALDVRSHVQAIMDMISTRYALAGVNAKETANAAVHRDTLAKRVNSGVLSMRIIKHVRRMVVVAQKRLT